MRTNALPGAAAFHNETPPRTSVRDGVRHVLRRSVGLLTASALLSCSPGFLAVTALAAPPAQARSVTHNLDIPAQPLGHALQALALASDHKLLYSTEVVDGKVSVAVKGELTTDEAVRRMLSKTDLNFEVTGDGLVLITAKDQKVPTGNLDARSTKHIRLSQSQSHGSETLAAAESTEEGKLEEIIVTAQKRKQRLSDVPLSISAFSNEEIERRGLVGASDYLRSLPGVNQFDYGAGRNSIVMRGVSVSSLDAGTVGYFLNDIPVTGYTLRGGADIKLVDLERVEVLRGPQGTLYGSASLGGAVRNIPNAPDLGTFKGSVKGGYSQTGAAGGDNSSVEGVFNLPIVADKLAIRAVGYRFENSGYVENIAGSDPATLALAAAFGVADRAINQRDVGSDRYTGARVAALFEPTSQFTATLTYLTQDIRQAGLPEVELIRPGKYQQSRLQMPDIVGGGSEALRDDLDIASVLLEYEFGWGSLLSSSAWIQEDYLEKRDIGAFFGGAPIPQRNSTDTGVFVQEMRFTSQFDSPLQLLVGLYYEDIDRKDLSLNFYGGALPTSLFGLDLPPGAVLTDTLTANETKQKAAFGELSYELREELKLTLGARRFNYDTTITTTQGSSAFSPAGESAVDGGNTGSTFKANLAYEPAEHALVYAQWSEGFRLGNPVGPAPPTCDLDNDSRIDGTDLSTAARALDPDELTSYELGTKLELMAGSLAVNAAAYRNEWRGLPVQIVVSCGFGALDNAGEARTQGVELGADYRVTPELRVTVAAAYTDAELSKDSPGIGSAGDRLPGTPRYSANLGAQYDFELNGMPAFVRGDYAYVSGFFNNIAQLGKQAGAYGQLNLRAGTVLSRIGIDVFVNNVTNSDALTFVDPGWIGFGDRSIRLRPRTVGLNARFTF